MRFLSRQDSNVEQPSSVRRDASREARASRHRAAGASASQQLHGDAVARATQLQRRLPTPTPELGDVVGRRKSTLEHGWHSIPGLEPRTELGCRIRRRPRREAEERLLPQPSSPSLSRHLLFNVLLYNNNSYKASCIALWKYRPVNIFCILTRQNYFATKIHS